MFSEGLLISKRPFQDGAMSGKNCSLQSPLPTSPEPTILQLNIESLNASKMNVLHYLALQYEALVIILQENHCTNAEKLVLSSYHLTGSALSRKRGFATLVHERLRHKLRYTLYTLRFWTNLRRHRWLSGCAWTLMVVK